MKFQRLFIFVKNLAEYEVGHHCSFYPIRRWVWRTVGMALRGKAK